MLFSKASNKRMRVDLINEFLVLEQDTITVVPQSQIRKKTGQISQRGNGRRRRPRFQMYVREPLLICMLCACSNPTMHFFSDFRSV